jgi:hypothetical protein
MRNKDQENINQVVLASQLDHVEVTSDIIESENFAQKYKSLDQLIKYLQGIKTAINTEIKKIIKENYAESGDSSIRNDFFTFTYVSPTTKEDFDVARFKEENPELYKKYVKITNVSDSLRTTAKKEKKREKVVEAESELDF